MIDAAVEDLESALRIIEELSAHSALHPMSFKRRSIEARVKDISHKLRVLAEHHRTESQVCRTKSRAVTDGPVAPSHPQHTH